MRFWDYIAIAFRNIRRQKLRSALTIFAVVIGATSVTIMLAAVFSLKGFMTKQFEANGTFQQVAVSPQSDLKWDGRNDGGSNQCTDCTKLTDDLAAKIATMQHVMGVAREVQVGQFQAVTYGNQKLRTYGLTSYDANSIIRSTILAGRDIRSSDTTGVVTLSSDYADQLGFKRNYQGLVGKEVSLVTQNFYSGVGSDPLQQWRDQQAFFQSHPGADGRDYQPTPVTLTAKIVGITDANSQSQQIRVPLEWARGMMENQQATFTQADQDAAQVKCRAARTPNCNTQPEPSTVSVTDELAKQGYNSFIVKVDQSSNAAAVAKNIKATYKVGAADAETEIKSQLAVFNILGLVLGGIGGIALVVAAVGVVNTMIMSILERTREIGVMRAVGARRGTVSLLFTIEAALLGFFGGVFGLGIGYGAVLVANPIINKQLSGNNITSSNIITLPIWLIVGVVALTTAIGIVAGLYPARRAARLDPVEALRYE